MNDVMTVDHPRWDEFIERLTGPEGCHFHYKVPNDVKSTTWKCSSRGHELATPILKSMGCDVDKSIAYFRSNGGCCDCEVIFNVKNSAEPSRGTRLRRRSRLVARGSGKKRAS